MIMLNQVAKFYAPLPFNLKMDKNFFARPYDIETVLCFYALYFGKTKANSDWFKLMSGAHAPPPTARPSGAGQRRGFGYSGFPPSSGKLRY